MTNPTIEIAALVTVPAAPVGKTLDAWQGIKNFGGGLSAGLLHGATGKVDQVAKFADTSSRATKAGFESAPRSTWRPQFGMCQRRRRLLIRRRTSNSPGT
jgi:hypothetical protein